MRRFELVEGTSSKFWEIEALSGGELHIRWGRIGTAGQSQTKSFDDDSKASAALIKLVSEKTSKGYIEVGVTASASTGKTGIKPKASAVTPSEPSDPAPSVAVNSESLDVQCDRVFEAVRLQIADGTLKTDDSMSVAVLRRQHRVSEQGASMAFQRLNSSGLLQGWGATAQVPKDAIATAQKLGETAMQRSVENAAVAGPVSEGTPPWLAQGEALRLTAQMRAAAFSSRRFPHPVQTISPAAAWLLVRQKMQLSIDLSASDVALRPAAQRVVDRMLQVEPGSDPEADALLLTLAIHTTGYYGESEPGEAIVNYLVALYGLPQTVDIWLVAQRVQVKSEYIHQSKTHRRSFSSTVEQPVSNGWRGPLGQAESALRNHLAMASEADWTVCADRIEAALPHLHPSRQPVLALLLPDRPELSNALALRLGAEKNSPETLHWLLLTATDPAAIAQAVKARISYSAGFWGLGEMVATAVLERGANAIAVLDKGAAYNEAGEALAAIGTPEAVTALAKVASASKAALARLSLAADRWPLAAIVALSRLVASGGKDAGLLTPTLTRLLRSHGSHINELRPWLDASAQAAIDRQLALLSGPDAVADSAELPRVLVAPPWLARVQKKIADAMALDPLALPAIERWTPGAKDKALALNKWRKANHDKAKQDVKALIDELGFSEREKYFGSIGDAAMKAIQQSDAQALIAAWRQMVQERKKARYYWFTFTPDIISVLPADVGVPFWNAIAGETECADVGHLLATYGLPVLPGLVALVRSKPVDNLSYALNFGAVELAMPAARAFAKLKTLRTQGRDWLLSFPEHAACGLIALALGKSGEARDCAGSALRLLQVQGHGALLLEVAGRYGDESVTSALRAVLEESPLDRFPSKRSKLPEWWQPRGWRRPVLLNGKALTDEALDHLGQMLTFPTNEEVYGGIAVVKEACQPGSLADFAWDAFSSWLEAGGPSKEGWALTALGLLGNDDTARRLTPFIRAWPGESAHARAVSGLDVLASIGTDVALMLLNGIAQKVKFKGLQDKAREKIDAIAEARGLSTEELEDRLAPDLGLDERGTLVLDFGPRAFRVAFDESLKPYVREVGEGGALGNRLPDLPKPKKTDDEAMAHEAVERFKLLRKDARTIASQQLLRLEVAMCARRRWTPELFNMFLVEHPLVRYIVQRLIWGVYEVSEGSSYGGTLRSCFRVAEDGSFTTAQDDPFDLSEEDNLRIGVPHALELPAAEAAAFGQTFADYELLQPFAQIGRDTYALSDDEKNTLKLSRWNGAKVPTGKVLGLVNKGWRRGQAQDAGCIWYFTKPLGAGKIIELHLDPGIIVGMVDEYPEQTLGDVQVGEPSTWGEMQNSETFTSLDAIAASELIRDLEALRG